ncbi:putative type IX secretion system sortase PorU2 [Dyadobacter luticola]|uniref:Gingipain domain-containing protein n=1 Tax=Dyadobacter luticola TaxID=1979387 RepID=A0A5R9KWI8_9BACT|nr:C25 family cysteine peptidase [Dyadobacter luticola]TLV00457.1 hypothetical protein FEN17_13295 [Dyadobacter luticola]
MYRIFAHTFLLLITFPVSAQKLFGNEWINPAQTYLKIPVAKTGFYKISGYELASAALPVDEILPGTLQMFRRGKEISITVNAGSSKKLGAGDQIIFYGERHDGNADSTLYVSPKAMPHKYYSLFSDTAAYFLTWRTDGGFGKRITQSAPSFPSKNVNYHFTESFQLFNSHYLPGAFYPAGSNFEIGSVLSDYDTGECWSGPELGENEHFTITFKMESALAEHFGEAEIELMLTGHTVGEHAFELWTGSSQDLKRKLTNITVSDYQSVKVQARLNVKDFPADGNLAFTLVPIEKGGHVSVSYGLLKYPQKTTFKDFSDQKTFLFPASENQFWQCENPDGIDFYNITDPQNSEILGKTDSGISLGEAVKVIGVKEFLNVARMYLVKFKNLNPADFDYLIISHEFMHLPVFGIDPVTEYATYRASPAGGNYKPLVINSSEVFDQFNYGDPGPMGLRNIISWLHQAGSLRVVFLIGKSIDPQKARKMANARNVDMVPNAGWPGSDVALAMTPGGKSDSTDSYPIIPVGRINASTSLNVYDYLQKVKALEAQPVNASWRRNILHLSGGRSRDELTEFKGYVKDFERKLAGSHLAVNIETISKQTDDPVEELPIQEHLNKGAALMTLFGHSGIDVTDIDIGYASDPKRKYNMHPRYPAVIVNGCASGSIFYSDKTLSSNWIFTPENGAVLFLAHTFNGVSTALKKYTETFYEVLADSIFTHQPFGNIQQEAIKRIFSRNPDINDRITAQQMNLHGDPAIRIFPGKFSDANVDSTFAGDPSFEDHIPPVMIASLDGREIENNETVSAQPHIDIDLLDQNIAKSDTTSIIIWLKKQCSGCLEKRLSLANATWKYLSKEHIQVALNFPEKLDAGTYLLTLQARDSLRNFAPDYQIHFQVTDEKGFISLKVSPNPSDSHFQFSFEAGSQSQESAAQFYIYNSTGAEILRKTMRIQPGTNAWYWHPGELPAGLYIYQIVPDESHFSTFSETPAALQGRLLWVR